MCRSFLPYYEDEEGNSKEAGRNNLGVVTLNLPRVAIESQGSKSRFWKILDERLEICHEALAFRVERVKEATPDNAPILYKSGALARLSDEDNVDDIFINGQATVSLGYIGVYETMTMFYGGDWERNPDAKEFSLEVLKYMSDKCSQWKEEEGYHFSLYSTPSESLTHRLNHLDRDKFGIIKDITDKDYYNNSFHLDVRKKWTPIEKIEFEKDYPQYASGGFIHYVEYPNIKQNLKALEAVWDYSYDKVGYLGTNTPIDKCFQCNFEGDFDATEVGYRCPQCGNTDPLTTDVVKRLCGYLGNPQARPVIKGRLSEMQARVKHTHNNL